MDRQVCFIDNEGRVGTCTRYDIASCDGCGFKKRMEGREREEGFSYTSWTGELTRPYEDIAKEAGLRGSTPCRSLESTETEI